MTCTPAPTCRAALTEATHRWPGRRVTSDGICASAAHHTQNPTSDHELGNAFDLSHDPDHGVDTYHLADLMRLHPDPRVKYVISNSRIWNPAISSAWRAYSGVNPHTHHMHVSIKPTARNDLAPWWDRYFTEDDMYSDADRARDNDTAKKVREIHDAIYKGHPEFGQPGIEGAIADIRKHVVT